MTALLIAGRGFGARPGQFARFTDKSMQLTESCGSESIIVAHKEDTSSLERSLQEEGFGVQVIRTEYSQQELAFSAIIRCLITHSCAWKVAARRNAPTVILEADFVPSKGFGSMPVPIPASRAQNSLGYLYACGPQIWDIEDHRYARGHAGAMVALFVPAMVAGALLEFFDEQMAQNPRGEYVPWDAAVGYWLKKRGMESYIPYRQYGEHGGIQNPEHRVAGLGRQHRADVLNGDLCFMPAYAQGSRITLLRTRLWARYWGIVRLLTGRFLAWHDLRRSQKREMLRFVIGRQFLQETAD